MLFFENPFNVRSSTLREATEPYLSSSAGGCLVTYVYAELSYAHEAHGYRPPTLTRSTMNGAAAATATARRSTGRHECEVTTSGGRHEGEGTGDESIDRQRHVASIFAAMMRSKVQTSVCVCVCVWEGGRRGGVRSTLAGSCSGLPRTGRRPVSPSRTAAC